jgi:hypothetical protein
VSRIRVNLANDSQCCDLAQQGMSRAIFSLRKSTAKIVRIAVSYHYPVQKKSIPKLRVLLLNMDVVASGSCMHPSLSDTWKGVHIPRIDNEIFSSPPVIRDATSTPERMSWLFRLFLGMSS